MRTNRFFLCVILFLFSAAGARAAETAAGSDKAAAPKTAEPAKDAKPDAKTAAATGQKAPNSDKYNSSGKSPDKTRIGVTAKDSLVIPSDGSDEYVVMHNGGGKVVTSYPTMSEAEYEAYLEGEELVAEYVEEEDVYVFPNGEVVTIKSDSSSDPWYSWDAFSLNKEYEKKKGFAIYANAGYKWTLLRKMGYQANGQSMRRNLTISGGSAAFGFGYSFGPDVPVALEVDFGIGPKLEFHNRNAFGTGSIDMRQKLNIYNLDASIDYDFKTSGPVTPFFGINTGFALVSDRGRMNVYDASNNITASGGYKWKHRVNLLGGLRLGAKAQVHENITLSAVAEYNYMGDIQSQQFMLSDGTQASTNRIKAHEVNLKLGARITF